MTLTLIQGIGVILVWLMAIGLGALIANRFPKPAAKLSQKPIDRWIEWEMRNFDTEWETIGTKK